MPSRKCILLAVFLFVLVADAPAQFVQQGSKLVGSGSIAASQGWLVALSADGNTAIVGGPTDGYPSLGSVYVFTRSNGQWSQQGAKLVGSGAVTNAFSGVNEGFAVAISGDGNTALVGGYGDNGDQGAAWVFTRTGTVWSQQGVKLTASDAAGTTSNFASSVALSADGNTAIVGGLNDNGGVGAAWIFTRASGVWSQVGSKLLGHGSAGQSFQGQSVALSGDGSTALVGGFGDNIWTGAAWIYTKSNGTWAQQGSKLTGSDSTGYYAFQGYSVGLSNDGNTAIVGGYGDNSYTGAAWVFSRSSGAWTQQGSKLTGSDAAGVPRQGSSVALSGDGNTALVGGPYDNGNSGAVWEFNRSGGVWTRQGGKLMGSGASLATVPSGHGLGQGWSVAISSDGSTAITGAPNDAFGPGAAWVFTQSPVSATTPLAASPGAGNAASQTMTFTFVDPRGWQDLDVVNVLINNFLDGRSACYLAYSRTSSVLYLVGDAGGGLSPLTLNASGNVSNSQCTISSAGSLAVGGGNTLTLTLNISFSASFAGNKVTYLAARDLAGGNSGWQALGAWSVPTVSTFPTVVGVSPARGAGSAATFTFTFNDSKGYQDLGVLNVLINNFLDGRNACYLAYSGNVLYIVGDAGGGLTGMPLNGTGSVSNSQCTVNGAGSSASGSGNNLTLRLNISFSGAFDGNRVIYMAARDSTDANNSGWQSMGSWTVR